MATVTSYFLRRVWSHVASRFVGELNGLDAEDPTRAIRTTPIVRIDGRAVTTRSGTVHRLVGPPRWPGSFANSTDDAPLGTGDAEVAFYLWGSDATFPDGADVPAQLPTED